MIIDTKKEASDTSRLIECEVVISEHENVSAYISH